MATILITGATGTVMNPLCARLLENGHTVVALVRGSRQSSPRERLLSSLRVDEKTSKRLFVVTGDITRESAGVSADDLGKWKGKIEKIIHGAASIKFDETPDMQVHSANVGGTKNVLDLAQQLEVAEFHYVSTAYVAGAATDFSETDLGETQYHRNAYERSKSEAEVLVRKFPGTFSIYRIPVVVGDSQTGEITSFSGYYGFFAPFWQLVQTLRKKSAEQLREYGIFSEGEGCFYVPLVLPCTDVGPINLVPIDWLTDMFIAVLKLPAQQRTFHFTHPHPRSVKETVEISTAYLGFKGITCGITHQESASKLLSRIQRSIVANIKPFVPYTSKDEERFDNAATVQALGQDWKEPPDIDSAMMGRLLAYAKRKSFGRT